MPYTEPKPGASVIYVEEDGKTTYLATVIERTKDPVSGDVTPEGRVSLTFFDPDWTPDPTLPGHGPHTVTDVISTANPGFDDSQPVHETENWPAKIETVERQVTPDIKPGRVTKAEGVPYEGFLPRDVTTRCWRYMTPEESAAAAKQGAKASE